MVQVVDSFIQLYGRAPTESEISKMMKIKAGIEKKANKTLTVANQTPKEAKERGQLGGRPKSGRTIKLTEKAKIINRMIKKGMTLREMAELLGVSHPSIHDIKTRYGLPRDDVE